MADQIDPIDQSAQPTMHDNRDPNLIHLHNRRSPHTMHCGKLALSTTRSTAYPALVTCPACRRLFTADQQRTASGAQTEPEDC